MEFTTHTSSIGSMEDNILSGTFLISSMNRDPLRITIHLLREGTRKIESRYFENYLISSQTSRHDLTVDN